MAISESESVAYGGMKSVLHTHPTRSPPRSSEFMTDLSASLSPLSKQNSIFSLTLDEIQLKSGRSVGSMNMDEFLANLWNNVEENQVSSQPNQNQNHQTLNKKGLGPSPNQQISIPTPLCKKTVDEVWSEIQKDIPSHRKSNDINDSHEQQSQHTFGEMTLEDFLVKAGIVQGPMQKKANPPQNASTNFGMGQQNVNLVTPLIQNNNVNNLDHPNYGMGNVIGMGFPSAGNNYTANGYVAAYPMFAQNKGFCGESSSTNGEIGGMMEAGMLHNKKRIIDGPPEVVVERRQRRMIKNRESAARSRARKQAYTVELELELNQLREENEKLKRVLEENEQKRKQEILQRKQKSPLMQKRVEKLKTIRRTISSGW